MDGKPTSGETAQTRTKFYTNEEMKNNGNSLTKERAQQAGLLYGSMTPGTQQLEQH